MHIPLMPYPGHDSHTIQITGWVPLPWLFTSALKVCALTPMFSLAPAVTSSQQNSQSNDHELPETRMLINKYERNSRDTKSPTDAKTTEWKSDEEYNFQSFPPNKLLINY